MQVIKICSTLLMLATTAVFGTSCSMAPDAVEIIDKSQVTEIPFSSWRHYGGDKGNTHYSELRQINAANVHKLSLAWRYDSAGGKAIHPTSELQINPLVVDGVLFGRNPLHNVFAVEAGTGKELWRFDPFANEAGLLGAYMRGLSYWQQGNDRRVFAAASHFLYALDASTGRPIKSFGDNGRIDLRVGLGREVNKISIYAPSPGAIFKDMIIMGTAVTEGEGAAPGDIRAYDVRSGKIRWTFHTLPHPGEFAYESWPKDAWKTAGGANAWAGMSVDDARETVYIPTGSPTPDFNGSARRGDNLFGNSIIAVNANTGVRRWHFQTVHHDLWDRDLSSAPTLVDIQSDGRTLPALAQASKQGVVYLLNRETGEPIFPINEVATPTSDVPGEFAAATQPQVTLPEPFSRQTFSVDDLTTINAKAHTHSKAQLETAQSFAYFRPIGLQPTVIFPGFYGGGNWGGGAFDPELGVYYINGTEAPHLVNMVAVEVERGTTFGFGDYLYKKHCSGCHGAEREGFYPFAPDIQNLGDKTTPAAAMQTIVEGRGRMMPFGNLPEHERRALVEYLFSVDKKEQDQAPKHTSAAATESTEKNIEYLFGGYRDFVDDRGYPAVKPPWGTLNAIDFRSGKRLWQIPLGEYAELSKEGIPQTGTRNYGGPVVTAGGVIFIAATADEKLRAFDKHTGELLWEYQLPAAGYATPATYQINGKQYLVITCGGGKLGTPAGDQYLAFALPD